MPALRRVCGYPAVDYNIAWDSAIQMHMSEMQRNPYKLYLDTYDNYYYSRFPTGQHIPCTRLYVTHLWKPPLLVLHKAV